MLEVAADVASLDVTAPLLDAEELMFEGSAVLLLPLLPMDAEDAAIRRDSKPRVAALPVFAVVVAAEDPPVLAVGAAAGAAAGVALELALVDAAGAAVDAPVGCCA